MCTFTTNKQARNSYSYGFLKSSLIFCKSSPSYMKWHYEIIIGFCVLDFTLKCVHLNWMSKLNCDLLL